MAMRCYICGKGSQYGHNISHAHNVTKRRFNPNLQSIRVNLEGAIKRVRVCTRCIRSGKVQKAV